MLRVAETFMKRIANWVLVLGGLLISAVVTAQPASPVRIIVPFPPGGGSDLFARLVAPGLSDLLKQPVIVENKPGAGGSIGADMAAKSVPDGRTLLVSDSAAYSISPSLYPKLPYAAKDLVPVADVARFANVLLVSANSPYSTIDELLKAARKMPGKLSIASAGNGSSPHLTAEKFQREAGISLIHVAYKGSGPAITDTIGGQVDMVFSGLPSVTELLKSGRLRAIAIASSQRSPFAPDVPTLSEAGVSGFESLISQGLFAPAGTPPTTVARINAAINQVMNSKELAPRLQQLRVEPHALSAVEYEAWLGNQTVSWSKLIKEAGIVVD
jgi:tripartite-type tricarboxylate transporter receptor subunit TctC